ncbi:MAG: lipopolysaccharide biosynthesis protein [Bryobacterales bacterium]|nr:lipopolysaccharide biosynthesis protein [Bryobacterales bacterium]
MASSKQFDRVFVGGLAWTAGAKWATQLLTWGSVVVLARLLSVTDFGIVALAGVYLVLTNSIAEFGLAGAVMLMRELGYEILAQLNTVAVGFGVIAALVCVATAPIVGWLFQNDAVAGVLQVASLSVLIAGFQLVPFGLLRRNLEYRRLALSEAIQAIAQAGFTVVFALLGWGYWSIVWGITAGRFAIAATLVSWHWVGLSIPKWKDVKAPLVCGWHLSTTQFATAVSEQMDAIIIGRVLGEALLGIYRMAVSLAVAPSERISTLIFRVTGPLFAGVQDDIALIRRYYLIWIELLSMSTLPLAAGVIVVASDVVLLVLGDKWAGVIGPLRWIAIAAWFNTIIALTQQVLVNLRKTKMVMQWHLARTLVMPVAFLAGTHWELDGVAAAWLMAVPMLLVPFVITAMRDIQLRVSELIGTLAPSVLASAVMVGAVYFWRHSMMPSGFNTLSSLTASVSLGGIVYAAVFGLFFREKFTRYIEFVKSLWRERQAKRQPAAAD